MKTDIVQRLIAAQDDGDTVVLPNACRGELVQLDDARLRCFSVLTRQPHTIAPESWSFVALESAMPSLPDVSGGFLVDHVTRGLMGDNAFRLEFDDDGSLKSMRLLPPGEGPAQAHWEAQASMMLESSQ